MSAKSKLVGGGGAGGGEYTSKKNAIPRNLVIFLCLASFCAGLFFTNRMWSDLDPKTTLRTSKPKAVKHAANSSVHQQSLETLDNAISTLELKLAAARAKREAHMTENLNTRKSSSKRKYFMVIGINTAFSSRRRRESVRATWMPQGVKLKRLEEEKGIIVRFVIGRSSSFGGVLDEAIDKEEEVHRDFLRLDHLEGYMELSAKTKTYFATAVSLWDAEFYIKVDDDVHVNLGRLATILSGHRNKTRVYVGCMKSGPVLARKGLKYHEPEHWKFGDIGNNYFRHATGQLYAISKDLATYIYTNQKILHKYANEDVSLGSWFIGLNVEHVNNRSLCCGTPPDCQIKAIKGDTCAASFDWRCSGICRPVTRMFYVHKKCGENENKLWNTSFSI